MDNQIAVSEFDGRADGLKKLQPGVKVEAVARAIFVDRRSVDILHRDERYTVGGRPRVQQAGDVRMFKRGEDLTLAVKMPPKRVRVHLPLQQFDRGFLFELSVGTL